MDKNIYKISYKLRHELYHKILKVIGLVLLCCVCVSLFMTFVFFPVANKTDSMAPDLTVSSCQFVTPLLKTPKRGDVVLVQNHNRENMTVSQRIIDLAFLFVTFRKWSPMAEKPSTHNQPMMRRVIGMPGDEIYIDRYVTFIKPKGEQHFLTEFEITESKYNVRILVPPAGWDTDLGAKSTTERIVLAENEYFVLGDNRLECTDSRVWGPVKQTSILGKVVMTYFPFNKIKFF